jgi:hypothetical protein
MDNLVDVFCDVDDFCAVFMPQWKKKMWEKCGKNVATHNK